MRMRAPILVFTIHPGCHWPPNSLGTPPIHPLALCHFPNPPPIDSKSIFRGKPCQNRHTFENLRIFTPGCTGHAPIPPTPPAHHSVAWGDYLRTCAHPSAPSVHLSAPSVHLSALCVHPSAPSVPHMGPPFRCGLAQPTQPSKDLVRPGHHCQSGIPSHCGKPCCRPAYFSVPWPMGREFLPSGQISDCHP